MKASDLEALTRVIDLLADGERTSAEEIYYEAVDRLRPNTLEAACACGLAALECMDYEGAIRFGKRAVKCNPRSRRGHELLGIAQRRLGLMTDAEKSFRRVLNWAPDSAAAWNNLGLTLEDRGELEEALKAAESGLSIEPDDPDLLNLKGSILCALGKPEAGISYYRRGMADIDGPVDFVHMNLGQALLQIGEDEEGWQEFSHRKAFLGEPPDARATWQGEDLEGKSIAVWHEQGLGDTIQFCRYLPGLADRARSLTFECQTPVAGLVKTLPGRIGVTTKASGRHDFECPLLDLARYCDEPAEPPYLLPSGSPHPSLAEVEGMKVGVVRSGSAMNPADAFRSIDRDKIHPVFENQGASFFGLGLEVYRSAPQLRPIGSEIDDIVDLAATIDALDLVITVDTLAAHLAGALGTSVWNLLAFSPDWRWGLEGKTTHWYPTMRLFRQPKPGDWDSVIVDVSRELTALAACHPNAGQ